MEMWDSAKRASPVTPLGFEAVGDQVEQGCTSTLGCCRDGVSQKSFVVEFRRIAVIELENAVFANHVGSNRKGRLFQCG